jgi:hypothetical protein
MLDFRARNLVPPGGRYFYIVPETGVRIEGLSLLHWYNNIVKHYRENDLKVPADYKAVARDYLCRHLPEGFCTGDLDGKPRARVITLQQVKASTSTLAAGNPRVTVGEARRRADTCSRCPQNDKSVCTSCVGVTAWATRLAGQRLGGLDDWLGICGVDATALVAKVHMRNIPDNDEYPNDCWRNK